MTCEEAKGTRNAIPQHRGVSDGAFSVNEKFKSKGQSGASSEYVVLASHGRSLLAQKRADLD